MAKPSESALHFECVKLSIRQDKNGYALVLSIHPDEVPEALLRQWVGQRYVAALVPLNDQDQPLEAPPTRAREEGEAAVALAGALCREPDFRDWLITEFPGFDPGHPTEGLLRNLLGISSRSELATNTVARKNFYALVKEYRRTFPESSIDI